MSVSSKNHNIQLVQIQSEERLATTSELSLAFYPVNGRVVLLKSRIRENLNFCSVRELIAASRGRWL